MFIIKKGLMLVCLLSTLTSCFQEKFPTAQKGCVFHGSQVKDIKVIQPRKSTHKVSWVYATIEPFIAASFAIRTGDIHVQSGGHGTKEKPFFIFERYKGAFDKFYKGKSGYLYKMSNKGFEAKTQWKGEVVSENDAPVISEYYMKDIFQILKDHAKKGVVKLYYYPDRPEFMPKDDSDLVEKVAKWSLDKTKPLEFKENFLKLHPHLKDDLEKEIKRISEPKEIDVSQ